MSNIQTLRFRRPIQKDQNEYAPKSVATRHTAMSEASKVVLKPSDVNNIQVISLARRVEDLSLE
jgi:hypothetical protein